MQVGICFLQLGNKKVGKNIGGGSKQVVATERIFNPVLS